MDIRFACPHCTQHIAIDEAGAGLQIDCPGCQARVIVPEPTQVAPPPLVQPKIRVVKPQPAPATATAEPSSERPKIRLAKSQSASSTAPSLPVPPPAASGPVQAGARPPARETPEVTGEFNLGLGILGAFIGALVGVGVMYGFYEWAGFRFPLLGVGIGVLTGFGAKILGKGADNTLGSISGAIALVAVVGTLYLMYGTFPIMSIISVIVSVSMAYRIATG